MGNGLAILAGLGKALQELPEGIIQGQKLDLAQGAQDEQRRQFDEQQMRQDRQFQAVQDRFAQSATTDLTPLQKLGILPAGSPASLPTNLVAPAMSALEARRKEGAEQAERGQVADFVRKSQGAPGELMGALGLGEDPEAAAFLPRTQATPKMSNREAIAGLSAFKNVNPHLYDLFKPKDTKLQGFGADQDIYSTTEDGGAPTLVRPGQPKEQGPQSSKGKAIADAERMFGKDSPQYKAAVAAFSAEDGGVQTAKLTNIAELRKEMIARSEKEFLPVRDAYSRMRAVSKDPSGAGDMALIFAYMKMLDPTSVVRESEYATAQNTGSIPQRIWAQYNRALAGEKLSPQQRADFLAQADNIMRDSMSRQVAHEGQYRQQADLIKVDPRQVVVDYIGSLRNMQAAPSAPQAPAAGNDPLGIRR